MTSAPLDLTPNTPRGLPEPDRPFVVALICVVLFASLIVTSSALVTALRSRRDAEAEIAVQKKLVAEAMMVGDQRRIAQQRAEEALAKAPKADPTLAINKQLAEMRLAALLKSQEFIAELLIELDDSTLDIAKANDIVRSLNSEQLPDEMALAQAQFLVGSRLSRLGYATAAATSLRNSYEARERLLGINHADTHATLNALALAYERNGSALPDGADPLVVALKTQTTKLGPDHPMTLATTSRLAHVHRRNNAFLDAIPLYEKMLARLRKTVKANDEQLAEPVGVLAELYRAAGKHRESLPLLNESLTLHKARFDNDHPHVLGAMAKLAQANRHLGDWEAALPILEDILKIRRQSLGMDHTETQVSLLELADGYRAAGEFDSALPLFEQRLEHLKAALGPNHTRTRAEMTKLAFVLIEAKELDRAGVMLKEITTAARKDSFAGKRGYAETLVQLGADLLHLAAYDPAEPMLRECLQIRERTDPNGWARAEAEFLLGVCLLGSKKKGEAEQMLDNGFDDLKKRKKAIPSEAIARIVRMMDVAVRIYDGRENAVAAKRWRGERDRFQGK